MTASNPAPAGLPREGELIGGKYRIGRLLGMGGVGAVYLANHEILQQPVAIKVLLPDLAQVPSIATRFLNEARAAAALRNAHVAQVMDVGTAENGAAFMVLEYLEGKDLAVILEERGPLPVEEAVGHVLQSLEAIAHAHAQGIVHRDLKPANLFLARMHDREQIKVLDFGISKNTEMVNASVTTTRTTLGSPGYMSPEQVRSAKNVDDRADIWSIGVILYKLLTNKGPFDGGDIGAVFAAILQETPKPIRALRADVPEALEKIVWKCLEKQREHRYADVSELAKALAPFSEAHGPPTVERITRVIAHGKLRRTGPQNQSAPVPQNPTVVEGKGVVIETGPTHVSPIAQTAILSAPNKDQTVRLGEQPRTVEVKYAPPDAGPEKRVAPPVEEHTGKPASKKKTPAPPESGGHVSRAPFYLLIIVSAAILAGTIVYVIRKLTLPPPALPPAATAPSAAITTTSSAAGAATTLSPLPTSEPRAPTATATPAAVAPPPPKPVAKPSAAPSATAPPDDSVLQNRK